MDLNSHIINAIQDVKGHEIVTIDTSSLIAAPADTFIIAQGNSPTQVTSIAEKIQEAVKDNCFLKPSTVQGLQNATWVILDYGSIIVHIFTPDTRKYYNIEQLWSDGVISIVPED